MLLAPLLAVVVQGVFTPPTGWLQPPNEVAVSGQLGLWQNFANGGYQSIRLVATPAGSQTLETFAQTYAEGLRPDESPLDAQDVTLCDETHGRLVHFQWTDHGVARDVHVMAAVEGGRAYAATYEHLAGVPDDPNAMASLSSLCPRVPLYVLQPPQGWEQAKVPTQSVGRVELLTMYYGQMIAGFRVNLNVVRDPLDNPNETIEQRAAETEAAFHSGGNNVSASHSEKVCDGSIDGWLIESSGLLSSSREIARVQTIALDHGEEYVATYSRPIGTRADPAAVKALDTLCPQAR